MTRGVAGTSARERVLRFYRDNPGEYLSAEDIAVKFGLSSHYARWLLQRMTSDGEIVWQRFYFVPPKPAARVRT